MDEADCTGIREIIRNAAVYKALDFVHLKDVALKLADPDEGKFGTRAESYLFRKGVSRDFMAQFSLSALRLLRRNEALVAKCLGDSPELRFLIQMYDKYLGGQPVDQGRPSRPAPAATPGLDSPAKPSVPHESGASRAPYATTIFRNWTGNSKPMHMALPTGIYQSFRRYKTELREDGGSGAKAEPAIQETDPLIICETIHIDAEQMECALVTWERYVYFGTLFFNEENILFGILQRQNQRIGGMNQRMLSIAVPDAHPPLPWFSGLCIKAGDTLHRPLAAECVFLAVPRLGHERVYAEFDDISSQVRQVARVEPDSEIARYLTVVPSFDKDGGTPDHVRYLSQFPLLREMAKPNKSGVAHLSEPLRTLDPGIISRLARQQNLRLDVVIQHNNPQARRRSPRKKPPNG